MADEFGLNPLNDVGLGFEGVTPTEKDRSVKLFPLREGGQGGANLLSVDGDYQMDANGRPLGMSAVAQRVFLRLFTIRGSAVDRTFGRREFPLLLTERTFPSFELIIREALAPMIRAGEIRLDQVSVDNGALGCVGIVVKWTDLTTSQPQITVI